MTDSKDRATVAIVVLNWNGIGDTIDCLTSLRQSKTRVHAILVDNGSFGDDVQQIRSSGLADTIIELGENQGFAEGNNAGLRFAIRHGFPVVGVLNNDTLIRSDTIGLLVSHLQTNEHRALSPDIRYFDRPAKSWFQGGVVDHGWPRHLQQDEVGNDTDALRRSECLSGCCIVARAETWQRVGLFDPAYFLIFEDSEWSLRARSCGVGLYVVASSVMTHKVSQSLGSGPSTLLAEFYYVRNGLMFELAYARSHIARFAWRWLIRPTLGAAVHRGRGRVIVFRWLGAVAFVSRVSGRAPVWVEALARRLVPALPVVGRRTDLV